jgi:electron transfer flavoprotein-quinone oxidoreductase
MYTNRETLSLGVVIQLDSVTRRDKSEPGVHTYQLWELFKKQPFIAKMIAGGSTVEYSAHMVPHGGYRMIPTRLCYNGVLLVGDAAGFVMSNGLTINGMNYAIASGILAADAVVEAKVKNDFSKRGLASYQSKVKQSYFYKSMKKMRKVDKILANSRLFTKYTEVITGGLKAILTENQEVKPKAFTAIRKSLKKNKVNIVRAALDALNARHL